MDTAEILRRVRRVEIKTARLATEAMSGAYHSVFKGRGMDFEELREYVAGDDIRTIDWNVTARIGRPFVKLHREERDLTVILAVDISGSFEFGSGEITKREFATELAATLAFAAGMNHDKVGLFLFTADTELYLPPRKGRRHTLRIIRELIGFPAKRTGTDLAVALGHLNRLVPRRAVVFLATDFLHTLGDSAKSAAAMKALTITNAHHDLVCLHLHDARESTVPSAGLLTLEDAETGELLEIDTRRPGVRERYTGEAVRREGELRDAMRKGGIDLLGLDINTDYAARLRRFLDNRRRRR